MRFLNNSLRNSLTGSRPSWALRSFAGRRGARSRMHHGQQVLRPLFLWRRPLLTQDHERYELGPLEVQAFADLVHELGI